MSIRPGTGSECGVDCFGDECMESMDSPEHHASGMGLKGSFILRSLWHRAQRPSCMGKD